MFASHFNVKYEILGSNGAGSEQNNIARVGHLRFYFVSPKNDYQNEAYTYGSNKGVTIITIMYFGLSSKKIVYRIDFKVENFYCVKTEIGAMRGS